MARRLVLISTSTVFGTRYLEHAYPELRDAFGSIARVLFIPHALKDRDAYLAKARPAFEEMGYGLDSLHEASDAREAIERAEAIFCGGGNTFRLLKALYEMGVLPLIQERVKDGMVYAGASAGSNLACPTIRTTNDMPIVQPLSLDALGLVPFQINPHWFDGPIHVRHGEGFLPYGGETRDDRLREFLEENDRPVLAIAEGGVLRVESERATLLGAPARLFRRGQPPLDLAPPQDLTFLLA